jgi:hypothetical protein
LSRKYAIDINRSIINLLYDNDEGQLLSYSELYKRIVSLRKKLPHDTFNTHLTQLQCSGLVGKRVQEGRKGYYLTHKARYLYQLKILELDRPNNKFLEAQDPELEQRLKMCLILSYYGMQTFSTYRLQSKEQLEEFLLKYNLRLDDMRIWEEKKDIDSGETHRHVKEFDQKIPDPLSGIRIRIVEVRKDHVNKTYYFCYLPGFSIAEILDQKDLSEFRYFPLTRSLVQAEIDVWLDNGLLEEIGAYDNEVRYRYCDRQFQLALSDCWDFFDDLMTVHYDICKYRRNPKKEEKRWLEFFYGSGISLDSALQRVRHDRSSYRRQKKQIENIRSLMHLIHEEFEELTLTTRKGQYLIHKLLEYIYPPFMRHSMSCAIIV